MKKFLFLFLAYLFFTNVANAKVATVTNDVFLQVKKSTGQEYEENFERILKPYILGVADSLMSANAFLKMNGKNEIFCQPDNLGLNVENYMRFASEQIEKDKKNNRYNGRQPLSISVLIRLIDVFPCK